MPGGTTASPICHSGEFIKRFDICTVKLHVHVHVHVDSYMYMCTCIILAAKIIYLCFDTS